MIYRSRGFILDLDNTLNRLKSTDGTFAGSQLKATVMCNAYRLLASRLGLEVGEAKVFVADARSKNPGPLSKLFESYGISRAEWFSTVWNIDPAGLIEIPGPGLRQALLPIADRAMVLTSGPVIWALPVLKFLGLDDLFEHRISTGEHEITKPDLRVFEQAAAMLERAHGQVVSIGDQNRSDIVPAKALGMTTVIVGPKLLDADFRVNTVIEALALANQREW